MGFGTLIVSLVLIPGAGTDADADGVRFFESRIRPVLVEHCYACHSQEAASRKKLRGALAVDTRDGLLQGGDGGPAVVPGKPDESPILDALRYDDVVKMPPKGKLPASVVADFEAWVRMGAPDPRHAPTSQTRPTGVDLAEGRKHWAYQPVVDPPVPSVRDTAWPLGPIDRFVLASLESATLAPAPDADRLTLLRRVSFDLVGLPPTPEDLAKVVDDDSPASYEAFVDRLLASPQFGERWGRHWLDVARFGESLTLRGFVFKDAWRYRDYAIETFNADRPFDRFLREQVAGDLLPASDREERRRNLIATTYLALGNNNLEEQDKDQLRMDVVDEQLDAIGKGMLAQTITCARCHDHKFDPIPTRDYYALAGIFRSTRSLEHANVSKWLERPLPMDPAIEARCLEQEKALARAKSALEKEKALLAKLKLGPAAEGHRIAARTLNAELERIKAAGPVRDAVMTVFDEKETGDARVHVRGSVHSLGATVPRGFLSVLSRGDPPAIPAGASGRAELADWLASPDNPLTARVMANRVWHWLIGSGIVRTPDNFGTTGERPTHPELLDHLASRLVRDGWSIKRLVRSVVLSRTYRMASSEDPRGRSRDPQNRLLGHMNRRRLDAESLHDAMLSISGALRSEMGGPGFRPDLESDYGFRHEGTRRSVYSPAFRNALPELLQVFDGADPSLVTGQRNVSTVSPQALYLMNHPFVVEQSRRAARRLLAEPFESDSARIDRAFQLALGRGPTIGERSLMADALESETTGAASAERIDAWSLVFQALFASLGFRYLD